MVAVALGTADGGNRGAVKLDKSANNHRHIFFGHGCRSPSVTILADAKQQIPLNRSDIRLKEPWRAMSGSAVGLAATS